MVQQALINKEVLRWARDRAGLDYETLARGITKNVERVQAWENSDQEDLPSVPQARKLADKLRVPFGYLFLSNPPREELPIPDLRTRGDDPLREPSPDLIDQLSLTLAKQEWYRNYQFSVGAQPLEFVGSLSTNTRPTIAGQSIREDLRLTDQQMEVNSWSAFLTEFVRLTEKAGILVMRSGIVGNQTHRSLSADEFQGFAISDAIAPLVFLNSKDYIAARIFTLAHELAHIWIGQSGITLQDPGNLSPVRQVEVEAWCDAVAAEILVPAADLSRLWLRGRDLDENVQRHSRALKVSSIVVLRRALDLQLTDRNSFFRQLAIERNRQIRPQQGGGGGINSFVARNSRMFTQALVSSANDGRVGYTEASRLLGVKVQTIQRLAVELGAR